MNEVVVDRIFPRVALHLLTFFWLRYLQEPRALKKEKDVAEMVGETLRINVHLPQIAVYERVIVVFNNRREGERKASGERLGYREAKVSLLYLLLFHNIVANRTIRGRLDLLWLKKEGVGSGQGQKVAYKGVVFGRSFTGSITRFN